MTPLCADCKGYVTCYIDVSYYVYTKPLKTNWISRATFFLLSKSGSTQRATSRNKNVVTMSTMNFSSNRLTHCFMLNRPELEKTEFNAYEHVSTENSLGISATDILSKRRGSEAVQCKINLLNQMSFTLMVMSSKGWHTPWLAYPKSKKKYWLRKADVEANTHTPFQKLNA